MVAISGITNTATKGVGVSAIGKSVPRTQEEKERFSAFIQSHGAGGYAMDREGWNALRSAYGSFVFWWGGHVPRSLPDNRWMLREDLR